VTYFKLLGQVLEKPEVFKLTREQVQQAWAYAYRFFFDFPRPFPWHLVRVWDDYKQRSIRDVFSESGKEQYGQTFRYLTGEPIDWANVVD
jgi:hypothetical protein